MKSLVVSYNSYSWIKFASGLISRSPNEYQVIIVDSDDKTPILGYNRLCSDAIYIQRRCDILNVGNVLGLKSVSNLNYNSNSSLKDMILNLQVTIMLQKPRVILYQNKGILNSLFSIINDKFKIPTYSFGININNVECKKVVLTEDEIRLKNSFKDLLVGINDKFYVTGYPKIEKFYKLGK